MGENSKIEWTDHTFNSWRGCAKVSPGCAHCYAETQSKRNPGTLGVWGANGERVVAAEAMWREPWKWNATAANEGVRRRVFCASMADVFEDWQGRMVNAKGRELYTDSLGAFDTPPTGGGRMTTMADVRERLFSLIAVTPWLDWLLLTKRPENVERFAPPEWFDQWPFNGWLGVSVEDQQRADERIPHLLRTPATVRFLSCEPLLGPLDLGLRNWADLPRDDCRIDWVIVGGESGREARPMHPAWVRAIREDCQEASVPFFFKQWGEWVDLSQSPHCAAERDRGFNPGFCPIGLDGQPVFAPVADREQGDATVYKFGKKAAGRLLDGREWSEFPAAASMARSSTSV